MNIELTISEYTLGDNSRAENQRFAAAVLSELKSEYPDADVNVKLIDNCDSGACFVDGDNSGEEVERVEMISNMVWEKADY